MSDPVPPAGILRSSAIVAVGTGLSRITGLVRVIALAVVLGRDAFSDAYYLANTTPNIIYELLIGGVLSATLVPLFVEADRKRDVEGPSALFSVGLTAALVLSIAAILASPFIGRVYLGGGRPEQLEVLRRLLALVLPQIFFYALITLATGALNARRRFVAAAFAPVLNNVVVVAVLAFLALAYGEDLDQSLTALIVLGVGTTAGVAAMTAPLVRSMRRSGFRLRWNLDWRHPMIRQVLRLSGWTFGYVAANQAALLIVMRLAGQGPEGTVTAYQVAFIFFQLPHGLVAVTLMTTFLPELSRAAVDDRLERFRSTYFRAVRLLLVAIMPAAVGYVILGDDLTQVLLSRGRFSTADAAVTGSTLLWFATGITGYSVYLFTLRAFYAMKDTRTPFGVNVVENLLNVIFAAVLVGRGAPGLAGAYSLAYLLAAVLALVALHRRIGLDGPELGELGGQVLRIVGATAVMALVVVAVRAAAPSGPDGALVGLTIGTTAGLATYAVAGGALRLDGFDAVAAAVARRLGRARGGDAT